MNNIQTFRKHFFIAVSILLLISAGVQAETWTRRLADGVTLMQRVDDSSSPQIINIIRTDPKTPGVRIQAVLGQDTIFGKDKMKGRETVSSIAKRLNAVAAVNADFFPYTGDPLNLHISGGELVSEPWPKRVIFGMTSDGKYLFDWLELDAKLTLANGRPYPIRGINRPRGKNEIVAYTPKFFSSTCTTGTGTEVVIKCDALPVKVGVPVSGSIREVKPLACDTPIPDGCLVLSGAGTGAKFIDDNIKPGDAVTIQFALKPLKTTGWDKVVEAVGGGPWLVRDGKINVDAKDEGFKPDIAVGPNPRTALGVTADGKLILATVSGRQSISAGMTLERLAALMKSEGCVNAMNLDGGGSTTTATSFGVLNSPSEGTERPVANAVAIFGNSLNADGCEVRIANLSAPPCGPADPPLVQTASLSEDATADQLLAVPSGTSIQLSLVDTLGQLVSKDIADRTVWSATGGAGFVDQSGRFYGVKAREGNIVVKLGDRTSAFQLKVVAGQPTKLTAKFISDPSDAPNRSTLAISVQDLNGNPVSGQRVVIKAVGGTSDLPEDVTGNDGKSLVGITWDDTLSGSNRVDITCQGLKPVIVRGSSAAK